MIYETSITNPKKQLEFYKDLSEQLQQENQELKKQYEECVKINIADHKYASSCEDKVIVLEAQQKKFIEYLNNYINALITQQKETVSKLDIAEVHVLMTLETILAQYKEIIGGKE